MHTYIFIYLERAQTGFIYANMSSACILCMHILCMQRTASVTRPYKSSSRPAAMLAELSERLSTAQKTTASVMYNWANAHYVHVAHGGKRASWAGAARGECVRSNVAPADAPDSNVCPSPPLQSLAPENVPVRYPGSSPGALPSSWARPAVPPRCRSTNSDCTDEPSQGGFVASSRTTRRPRTCPLRVT